MASKGSGAGQEGPQHVSLPLFPATGIGSVPFLDIPGTCRTILDLFPLMPFWPQFVKRTPLESMMLQYSEGLPLIELDRDGSSLFVAPDRDRETELVAFYDRFFARDLEAFAMTPHYAPGLYHMLEIVEDEKGQGWIKGQVVGPVTFLAGIKTPDGKRALHDPELVEALGRALALKALWQVRRMAGSGRLPVLFLDEPYLSGFGSAFSPLDRREVVELLRLFIGLVREHDPVLVGIHCCGNTDWSMLLEAGPDIINFDAFDYLDAFLLYREELVRFVRDGGIIAWGMAPTSSFTGQESAPDLLGRLAEAFRRMESWGLHGETLKKQSILTPSCGMGTMHPEAATQCMELLSKLAHLARLRASEGGPLTSP